MEPLVFSKIATFTLGIICEIFIQWISIYNFLYSFLPYSTIIVTGGTSNCVNPPETKQKRNY